MGGECKPNPAHPETCELDLSSIHPEPAHGAAHWKDEPIRLSVNRGEGIHIKHKGDFTVSVELYGDNPRGCGSRDKPVQPFQKVQLPQDSTKMEFTSGPVSLEARGCSYALKAEPKGGPAMDPHIFIDY